MPRRRWRRAALPVLLVLLLHGAAARAAPAPDLLLEVRVDQHLLSDAIASFQQRNDVLLPLGEVARLLTIAIRVQPGEGTASGYILQETRPFRLDLAAGSVTIGSVSERFDPALVRRADDDIYVASGLLARWLPAAFDVDMASLSLRVKPREQLPVQARLERKGRSLRTGAAHEEPSYPKVEVPYALASVPFADQTLGIELRRSQGAEAKALSYTGYLTGDLLGAEAALYLNTGTRQQGPAARLVLGRRDPDGALLGPLRARTAQLGSIVAPGVPYIANSSAGGNGVLVSNRLLGQPTSTDRHSLQGDLPPGWEVELYFNEALIGYQAARPDGRYGFDDQPLIYGANDFRLVFHGPLGQVRVERHSFQIEQSMLAAGELAYTVSAQRDAGGRQRIGALFDWGLHQRLTASAGLIRMPLFGHDRRYAHLALQGYTDRLIWNATLVRSDDGGSLLHAGARTSVGGVAIHATHARANNFSSEFFTDQGDQVRVRDELRADGVLATLPVSVVATRDRLESGASRVDVSARLSAYRMGMAISKTLRWRATGGQQQADGMVQASRRVAGIGVSGQLLYLIKPAARLGAAMLSADRYFGDSYQVNASITRTFIDPTTSLTVGLNKSLGRFGMGLNAFRSNRGDYGVGLQLFIATGRDARTARWITGAAPMAGSGAASMRVFLDRNRNGRLDDGEAPVAGAGFTVNGNAQMARTDAAGTAWLARLPTGEHVNISIDASTLEDPQWHPLQPGMRIVPRPGKVGLFDVAIGVTGEIDGTAWRMAAGLKRPAGDLEIELLDASSRVVGRTTSAADGYYVLTGVAPGRYRVQIAPGQLARLGFKPVESLAVNMDDQGNFVNGKDFTVSAD